MGEILHPHGISRHKQNRLDHRADVLHESCPFPRRFTRGFYYTIFPPFAQGGRHPLSRNAINASALENTS